MAHGGTARPNSFTAQNGLDGQRPLKEDEIGLVGI